MPHSLDWGFTPESTSHPHNSQRLISVCVPRQRRF